LIVSTAWYAEGGRSRSKMAFRPSLSARPPDAAERGQVVGRRLQPPGADSIGRIGGGPQRPQHGLVEVSAVGLGHVVGELGEGGDAQTDDHQGGQNGELDAGEGERAAQIWDGFGGKHRPRTVKLKPCSRSRLVDRADPAAVASPSRLFNRLIPRPDVIRAGNAASRR